VKCIIMETEGEFKFYALPEEYKSVAEFVDNIGKTLKFKQTLTNLNPVNCLFPVFIKDDFVEEEVTIWPNTNFYEREVGVVSRAKYDELLANIVKTKCSQCKHYEDHPKDDLGSHRFNIALDGKCPYFEMKNESNS